MAANQNAGKKAVDVKVTDFVIAMRKAHQRSIDKFNEISKNTGVFKGDEEIMLSAVSEIVAEELKALRLRNASLHNAG